MTNVSQSNSAARLALAGARRIVVKIGSRVLVQNSGRPELPRLQALVKELAELQHAGRELAVVTSGAIGTGMAALGMRRRPTRLPDLQTAAAVGQSRLMTLYDKLFSAERCIVGQVLLTHDDLKHRARHLNARNTMLNMLQSRVIPIVNENDVVAVDEIKFGDNDLLASLVTHLIEAELLILLTTTDGLRETLPSGVTRRVPLVTGITREILALATGKDGELSTGGMASKLEAAGAVAKTGARVVIADGRQERIISRVLAGEDTGTLILPAAGAHAGQLTGRKRWLAFFHRPQGALIVDEGARRAIARGGKSLLPIGVKGVEGEFDVGAAVDVKTPDNTVIARGLTAYSSADIRRIQGRRTQELAAILGAEGYAEVIHRDNLVVIE